MSRWMWRSLALALISLGSPCGADEPPSPQPQQPPQPAVSPWVGELADLVRRAREASGRQEHQAAFELYSAALDVLRARLPDSMVYADLLTHAAVSLVALGRWVEVLALTEESLALARRLVEGDHEAIAQRLSNRARALLELGRISETVSTCEQALGMWRRLHPGDHPSVASDLTNLGTALHLAGRWDEALRASADALAMRRRLHAGDHPEVANCIHNHASLLTGAGRPAEALPLHEEALAQQRRLFAGDHSAVAQSLSALGAALGELGRNDEALRLQEASLAMHRRLAGGDQIVVAAGLANLAVTLHELGRDAEALPLHHESLAMLRRLLPPDHDKIATGLGTLASTLAGLGRFAEAQALESEALAMRRRLFPGDHPQMERSLNALAYVLDAQGRTSEAQPLFEEALGMARRLFPGDSRYVATGLNNLAHVLNTRGRPADALPLLEEAVAMWQRIAPEGHPGRVRAIGNLAGILQALGRPTEALAHREQSLAMSRQLHRGDHPALVTSINALGHAYDACARPEDALPAFEEALAMSRRLWPGDHPHTATALHNVAHTLHRLGRHAEALARIRETLALRRRLFEGDHPSTANTLSAEAAVLQSLELMAEALAAQQLAFEMAVRLGSPDRWQWGTRLGYLLIRSGRPGEALEPLRVAIDALEELRSGAGGLRSEERAHYVGSLREWGDPYALLVAAQGREGRPAEAFETLERGRGREMLAALGRAQVDPVDQARVRARDRGDEQAVERIEAALTRRAAAEADVLRMAREVEQARARRESVRALAAEEAKARRAFLEALSGVERVVRAEMPGAQPLTVPQVQALLAPGDRLLAYSLWGSDSRGFVVGPESLETFEFAASDLEADVDAYAQALARPQGDPATTLAPEGRRLHERLLSKAAWEAVRGAQRLYLMADGALHRLPFEALVVGASEGRPVYWAEVGPPIAYVPSASVLAWLSARPRSTAERADLVALADPLFAGSTPPATWPKAGLLVTEVRPGSQAERLGLRPGDVLVAYDGKETADGAGLGSAMQAAGEGRSDIALGFVREGQRLEVIATSGTLGVSIASEPPDVAAPKLLAGGQLAIAWRSALERGRRLQPLPGSRREVEAIHQAFRAALGDRAQVTTLLGNQAREAALFEATRSPRVLHLATHGLADETETASFSSLALTPPAVPVPGDDGFLTLVDLFTRWRGRLEGTDLVVLSACESAKGRLQRAEGMYALPWGFLYAGARAVVGSLWKVDDESAAFLMTEFYRRYLEGAGQDALGALAAARLATKAKYPHPAHWAAFTFTGAPR